MRSIPSSKNDFRASVQRELEVLPRAPGGRFVSSDIEKTPGDIEMGNRKPSENNRPDRTEVINMIKHLMLTVVVICALTLAGPAGDKEVEDGSYLVILLLLHRLTLH